MTHSDDFRGNVTTYDSPPKPVEAVLSRGVSIRELRLLPSGYTFLDIHEDYLPVEPELVYAVSRCYEMKKQRKRYE